MQIARTVASLRAAIADLRRTGGRVALVPTMGALHDGHLALVNAASMRVEHVVVSIFVNPRQFGPNEDYADYPRQEQTDLRLLEDAGVSLVWAPNVETMYPAGYSTSVSVSGITRDLDGAARPGHFEGVATVVLKLFNQVRPDVAIFGEKDFQQLAMVRRLAHDLDTGVEVVGCPTDRAEDGLALSSRNAYLSPDQRINAATIPRVLGAAAESLRMGEPVSQTLLTAKSRLEQAGFAPIDYLDLRDASTLEPVDTLLSPARLMVAAWLGTTRLIDNMAV
ncbi:pantoate--beta-alanine ligase [Pseudomonas sp. D(2018)]|uniref:pantoate--beta-alanine ligase n=1 Tax=Pseudomonas sp. D(2018) TaxID=2502238 RepID=UPI0010F5577B|nr:pantoate--beta-alanine ligase [Pseudomonas sp. D(2018)]